VAGSKSGSARRGRSSSDARRALQRPPAAGTPRRAGRSSQAPPSPTPTRRITGRSASDHRGRMRRRVRSPVGGVRFGSGGGRCGSIAPQGGDGGPAVPDTRRDPTASRSQPAQPAPEGRTDPSGAYRRHPLPGDSRTSSLAASVTVADGRRSSCTSGSADRADRGRRALGTTGMFVARGRRGASAPRVRLSNKLPCNPRASI
jgi:hypothetical protein